MRPEEEESPKNSNKPSWETLSYYKLKHAELIQERFGYIANYSHSIKDIALAKKLTTDYGIAMSKKMIDYFFEQFRTSKWYADKIPSFSWVWTQRNDLSVKAITEAVKPKKKVYTQEELDDF